MGSVGLGTSFSSLGTQYNFTKMTNGQAVNAANTLLGDGKISVTDAETLDGFAMANLAPNSSGQLQGTYSASDPTQHNFIALIQQNIGWTQSTGFTQAENNDKSLLNDLMSIQSES